MKRIVAIKIDVTKIDKERLYKGEKGLYLDAVAYIDDNPDEYGQAGMITQSVSKEEREQGVKGNILGNTKLLKVIEDTAQPTAKPIAQPQQSSQNEQSNLPWWWHN